MSTAIHPKITHQLTAEGIYTVNFFGQTTFEAVLEFVAELKVVDGLPKDLLVLYDLSKASFELSQSELKEISEDFSNKVKDLSEFFSDIIPLNLER